MRNILLNISYDGSNYFGWQIQPDSPTVQQQIERALSQIIKKPVRVSGAGRTDAKAHSICYSLNFQSECTVPNDRLPIAMNSILPDDIRVVNAVDVPDDFHAQFSATAREYVYFIINSDMALPMFRNYAYIFAPALDIQKLCEVAKLFVGKYDFVNFCYGYGDEEKNFVREIFRFRVVQKDDRIFFFIKGNGFLRGMIRSIVAVCINYSLGKIDLETVRSALDNTQKLNSKYCVAVPACGLYFKRAFY